MLKDPLENEATGWSPNSPEQQSKPTIVRTKFRGGMSELFLLTDSKGTKSLLKFPKQVRRVTSTGINTERSFDPSVEAAALKGIEDITVKKEKITVRAIRCFGKINLTDTPQAQIPLDQQESTVSKSEFEIDGVFPSNNEAVWLEYLEGYQELEQIRESHKEKLPEIMDAILEFINNMIKAGVATRDLKPGNFLVKEVQNGAIEVVFIDLSMCVTKEYGDTSTPQDIGTLLTSFPPNHNYTGNSVTFEQESLSMRWSALLMCFQLLYNKYPFKLKMLGDTEPRTYTMDTLSNSGKLYLVTAAIESLAYIKIEDLPLIEPEQDNDNRELFVTLQAKLSALLREYQTLQHIL